MKRYLGLFLVCFVVLLITLSVVLLIQRENVDLSLLSPLVTKTKKISQATNSSTLSSNLKVEESVLSSKVVTANFIITTEQGNNLLVLVNKKIRLSDKFTPMGLVDLDLSMASYSGIKLISEAEVNLRSLFAASASENLHLTVVSGYRSYPQQVSVFNSWVASAGLKSAESFSARPGHSQHQLGTAVDFGIANKANFSESFGVTAEGVWLANNANKYGFVLSYPKGKESITGYSYEPWHYRYIGVENAQKMTNSGLILEEFLQKFGTW